MDPAAPPPEPLPAEPVPLSPPAEGFAGWLPDRLSFDEILFFLEVGGPVVALLLLMSLLATTLVVAKLLQFRAHDLGATAPVLEAAARLRRGERKAAMTVIERSRHPVAAMVRLAAATGDAGPDWLRTELTRVGRNQLAALRSHVRGLEIIAALAPLLGLFGTVLGMIGAFSAMEAAGGAVDPTVLSGGIWQALMTTAVGLAVAMPTVAAVALLERRVERVAELMDDVTAQLLTPPLPPTAASLSTAAGPAVAAHAAS